MNQSKYNILKQQVEALWSVSDCFLARSSDLLVFTPPVQSRKQMLISEL